MWQGREIVPCTLAFLAGNALGSMLMLPPLALLATSLVCALWALFRPGWGSILICFLLLGAASLQTGRMPPMPETPAISVWASDCKASFSDWLGGLVPEGDELAVLRALAIGDRSGLPWDLKEAYRGSGAMHLLALSGVQVGLMYVLLARLLSPLGGHRAARLVRSAVTLALLGAYALVSGLSPSICRAVIMISVYEISGLISGDRDGLPALAGSALVLMLADPEVTRDIGFQLSYTAVLSILLVHPWLKGRLQTRSRLLRTVWELLSVSLCCQATCGVLAWWYFGSFPKYFMLTTLIAIPLTTAVMYAIAAAVGSAGLASLATHLLSGGPVLSYASWLTSLFGTVSDISASILNRILNLLNTIIRLIASL